MLTKIFFRFLQVYLIFVLGLGLGIIIMQFKVWPYRYIFDVYHFAKGALEEDTTFLEKIVSDLEIRPARSFALFFVTPIEDARPLPVKNLRSRRDTPQVYLSSQVKVDYLVISGVFDFETGLNGAVLLNTETGKIDHQWIFPDDLFLQDNHLTDHHVFEILEDGSVIFSPAVYGPLYKYGVCGKQIWEIDGMFHHSISKVSEKDFWVLGTPRMPNQTTDAISLVDVNVGQVTKTIFLQDIHNRNMELPAFNLNWVSDVPENDLYHLNDADPLPAHLANYFPRLETGDLLVSYRHSNLIFVFDPDTLVVKWWTQSHTSGQHDPDWQKDGKITVFDNRTPLTSKFLQIREFSYQDRIGKVIYDGEAQKLSTYWRGKHQLLDDGSILLVVHDQGRVVIVDPYGEIVFDFVNLYDAENLLRITNAIALPRDFFNFIEFPNCEAHD